MYLKSALQKNAQVLYMDIDTHIDTDTYIYKYILGIGCTYYRCSNKYLTDWRLLHRYNMLYSDWV